MNEIEIAHIVLGVAAFLFLLAKSCCITIFRVKQLSKNIKFKVIYNLINGIFWVLVIINIILGVSIDYLEIIFTVHVIILIIAVCIDGVLIIFSPLIEIVITSRMQSTAEKSKEEILEFPLLITVIKDWLLVILLLLVNMIGLIEL